MLAIINVILLVLGCFMEGIAIMLLTVPIFLPIVGKLGIDPVHFGVVMTLNLMIGIADPAGRDGALRDVVGGKRGHGRAARELVPFMISIVAVLVLITFVPGVVTWLPKLIMG